MPIRPCIPPKSMEGQQVQAYESWMAQSESEHMRLNRELGDALRRTNWSYTTSL